jgi:serine protease AprX
VGEKEINVDNNLLHSLPKSVNWGGRAIRAALALTLVLTLFSAMSVQAQNNPPRAYPALLQMAKERPDEKVKVIVQRFAGAHLSEQALAHMGGKKTKDLPIVNGFAMELPAQAAQALAKNPAVRWVSLDAPMASTSAGDWSDPGCADCVDTANLVNAYVRAVGADQLWNEGDHLQGQGVTVAVLDSGLNAHADFQSGSRVLASLNFTAEADAGDTNGHGMHVAGIIGGDGASSSGGRIGVAPKVNLINLKVIDYDGRSLTSDVIEALQWILANKDAYNIRVVNMSLNSALAEPYHASPLDAAVEILWFNGIVVVVSAGNNGSASGPVTLYPPANDPFVITVGASEDKGTAGIADDTFPNFSAYGVTEDGFAKPDIVAPGRNIISLAAGPNGRNYKAHPAHRAGADHFRMSGTSMAAPVVAGAAALLLQDEPNLTPDQVKYRLMATANQNWSGYTPARAGAGYLDVYAAVHSATTGSANAGIPASQMLFTGSDAIVWNSVNWNSVNWNSVNWNSVNWNSVNWNSVNWNSGDIWDD